MVPNAENYDFKYYQDLVTDAKDTERLIELRKMASREDGENSKSGSSIAGTAAKNILKSGDFSVKGIAKGISKATKQQKKKSFLSEFKDEFLEESGIHDIQDEFTEIGNEFREGSGLKPKMTNADRKELEELEKKMEKKKIKQEKEMIEEEKEQTNKKSLSSVNEQLEALKKAKELLDAGVLTQEEFEKKKKELLDL